MFWQYFRPLAGSSFRSLMQYSVHKRITVSSEQGQGKNKQMFVVNKYFVLSKAPYHLKHTEVNCHWTKLLACLTIITIFLHTLWYYKTWSILIQLYKPYNLYWLYNNCTLRNSLLELPFLNLQRTLFFTRFCILRGINFSHTHFLMWGW